MAVSLFIPGLSYAQTAIGQYPNGTAYSNSGDLNQNRAVNYSNLGNYTNYIDISDSQLIAVQLSQACLTLIKENITNICPPYDKIKNNDNTNPIFAGLWVGKPYYHRLAPKVLNHYNFNPNKFIVMVDPNPDFTARARVIDIVPNPLQYTLVTDNATSVRLEHYGRFITNDCSGATVGSYSNMTFTTWLISDTVKYLESGCTKTQFNDTKVNIVKQIPFNYNNPYSILHENAFMSTILRGHSYFGSNSTLGGIGLGNCITQKCNLPSDPYHNKDPKFGWN